jgi:hypothetical protein
MTPDEKFEEWWDANRKERYWKLRTEMEDAKKADDYAVWQAAIESQAEPEAQVPVLSDAIKQVFDEMNALTDEEFWAELDSHKDTDLTRLFEYAMESHEPKAEAQVPECSHPSGYRKSIVICGLCGEQR